MLHMKYIKYHYTWNTYNTWNTILNVELCPNSYFWWYGYFWRSMSVICNITWILCVSKFTLRISVSFAHNLSFWFQNIFWVNEMAVISNVLKTDTLNRIVLQSFVLPVFEIFVLILWNRLFFWEKIFPIFFFFILLS